MLDVIVLSYQTLVACGGVKEVVYLCESWCTSPAATRGCPAPSGPWSSRWRLQCFVWVSYHLCALYNRRQTNMTTLSLLTKIIQDNK